jgi:hypothetical protein
MTQVPLLKIPKINDFYKLSYESRQGQDTQRSVTFADSSINEINIIESEKGFKTSRSKISKKRAK